MLEPGSFPALFHAPRGLDGQSEFEIGKSMWRRGLERAGVVRNLDDLPESQVYRLFLSMPSRGIEPDVAGRLYLQILGRDTFDPEQGEESEKHFLLKDNSQFKPLENAKVSTMSLAMICRRWPGRTFVSLDLPFKRSHQCVK